MYLLTLKCESRWASFFVNVCCFLSGSRAGSVFRAVANVSSSAPFSGANLYTWTEQVLKTFVLQSHSLTCDVLVPAAAANNESCVVSLT